MNDALPLIGAIWMASIVASLVGAVAFVGATWPGYAHWFFGAAVASLIVSTVTLTVYILFGAFSEKP